MKYYTIQSIINQYIYKRIMLEIQIILQNFLQTADVVNDYW